MHEHEPSAAPHAPARRGCAPRPQPRPHAGGGQPAVAGHRSPGGGAPHVENGQDCAEVLIQLAAVRSALTSTGKLILQDHLEHCIVDAIERGDREPVDQLMKAIEQFVK